MPRTEYKYLVPMGQLDELRELVLPHVEMDAYAAARPEHEYTVRSLYLDTPNMDYYHEKLAGLKERKKIRIRGYNEISASAPVFLEIKRKKGKAVLKTRSKLLHQDLFTFLETSDIERFIAASSKPGDAEESARQFLFHFHRYSLRPIITVAYEREAFFFKFDRGLRITFDKNLRFHNDAGLDSLLRETGDLYAMPGSFILETKSDSGFPIWLRLILSRLGLNQEALSKYTICIDALKADGGHLERMYPWTLLSVRPGTERGD
jgi:hypothetical protein